MTDEKTIHSKSTCLQGNQRLTDGTIYTTNCAKVPPCNAFYIENIAISLELSFLKKCDNRDFASEENEESSIYREFGKISIHRVSRILLRLL